MILRVGIDQFPQTVKRLMSCNHAYLAPSGVRTTVSAADHKSGTLILSSVETPVEETKKTLEDAGMEVFEGSWSVDGADESNGAAGSALYVAAVAYASEDSKPGLWIDSYPEEPTLAQVMRAMYDEFMADGEVPADVSLEEFIRLANSNVMILSPDQLSSFAERKAPC
jgi:hypothetical protein